MAVLVLGGYGLIGRSIVRRLRDAGREVIGLGRDVRVARRRFPEVTWREADLSRLTTPAAWAPLLDGVEAVVNAAGVLQASPRDDLVALHATAISALVKAAPDAGVTRIVQVSAVGARADAATEFMRTKAAGDAAIRAAAIDWVILRPGLVIAPVAYGGTAMLRGLAAFPGVTPLVMAASRVRTVCVDDVAEAVVAALNRRIPSGACVDLVGHQARDFAATVALFRAWLGLSPASALHLPTALGAVIGRLADGLGLLGWRPPMRTTALAVMAEGVDGDPGPAREALGRDLTSLAQVLAAMPASAADLWFARLWLLKPLVLGALSLFWIASGLIGVLQAQAAETVLTGRGVAPAFAAGAVWIGSALDLGLGLALAVRRSARAALIGMCGLTGAYVAGSALLAPGLWLDPMGPMLKTVPILILCLVGLAILEDR